MHQQERDLDMLSESAVTMGVMPLKRRQMRRSRRYRRWKLWKVRKYIRLRAKYLIKKNKFRGATAGSLSERARHFGEIMEQLRAKFTASDKASDQIRY